MRTIKFRAWDVENEVMMFRDLANCGDWIGKKVVIMQFTGLKDKNGKEIYEGDVVEFTNKWEWYRGSYAIKMMFADIEDKKVLQDKYDSEPMYRFLVEFDPHEGWNLSKSDIQNGYYQVIGNIYENPELLK